MWPIAPFRRFSKCYELSNYIFRCKSSDLQSSTIVTVNSNTEILKVESLIWPFDEHQKRFPRELPRPIAIPKSVKLLHETQS